jgi:ribosomal protein L11 methylase PrmA
MITLTENIQYYDVYNHSMSLGIEDKAFFKNLIEDYDNIDTIVDFGCADGTLIKHLWDEKHRFIGYDIDPNMLKFAKENLNKPNVFYTSTFPKQESTNFDTLLCLNSVIHEVYSYSEQAAIDIFWKQVFESNFKWITIRDMCPDKFSKDSIIDIDTMSKFRRRCDPRRLGDYENIWGEIKTEFDIAHFLLKYKYLDNWTRECKENYFPISIDKILEKIPENYKIRFQYNFTLPYLKKWCFEELGVTLKCTTHIKLILERK